MGLITDLAKQRENIEAIGLAKLEENVLNIHGDICYYFIPLGFVDRNSYHKDIKYSEGGVVSLSKYVAPATYYTHLNPISLNLMATKINLKDEIVEILKKHSSNIYEIDVILGGMLKDMNINGRHYYSWECEKLHRIDNYNVNFKIPSTIAVGKENVCICSAYQPDKIYYISSGDMIQ